MRLYAICLVKNEDDIIGQCLAHASRFCDRIFVFDNGSTDKTWEIVDALARTNPKIIPFEQSSERFHDGLRARVYNEFKNEMSNEDWWLFLDADEFLAESPSEVILDAMREDADVINAWQIQFYYTEIDHQAFLEGRDSRSSPVFSRRRYYSINWQEPRLFRNRREVYWNGEVNKRLPAGFGRVAKRRILNRHYQFRDPEQIEKRLLLRYQQESFRYHVKSIDWKNQIRESRLLIHRREGDPWRFTLKGVGYYYWTQLRRRIVWKVEEIGAALRKL